MIVDKDDNITDAEDPTANNDFGFANGSTMFLWLIGMIAEGGLAKFERIVISDNIFGNR